MRPGIKKTLKWIGIVLAVLIAAHATLVVMSGIRLRRAYADLRKDGRPMRAEEIIPPPVADAQNGALLYESAFSLFRMESAFGTNLLSSLDDTFASPNKQAEIGRILANDRIVMGLALLEQATAKPACRFDIQYDKGAEMLLPHISKLRQSQRLVAAKVRWEAARGNADETWKWTLTGIKMAEAAKDEPILISQLFRIAQIGIMTRNLRAILESMPPDDIQAETVSKVLASLDDVKPFLRAFDGERLLCTEWLFSQPRTRMGDIELYGVNTEDCDRWDEFLLRAFFFASPSWLKQLDHAASLDWNRELIRMAEMSLHVTLDASQLHSSDRVKGIPRWYPVTRTFMPAFSPAFVREARILADIRLAQTALALRRHKIVHQSYPATLAELDKAFMPDALMDPFSGKPFLYRADGDGYILYSVGDNGKDDGGKPEPWATTNGYETAKDDWDIVWKASH